MFGKFTAVLGLTALIAGGTSHAASQSRAGEWIRETRQLGNKVTVDVYHRRAPYALSGGGAGTRTSSRWTRETRQIGNKVTVDVFTR